MRNNKTYNIALASVCAALSTAFLCIGFFVGIGEFLWYFCASFVYLPMLSRKMLKESVAAFFVTTVLSLILVGFNYVYVLPYAVLFGFYPMLFYWLVLKVKSNLKRTLVKLSVFEFGLFLMWRFTFLFVGETEFLEKYMLPILLLVGVAIYFMYDIVISRLLMIVDYYMKKGKKK